MTPQERSTLARCAEDITVAGRRALVKAAERRDDHRTVADVNRAHDWLLTRISEELRPR